ncbi:MAG: polymerase subunit sigma-24, partial [Actinomycetia bacterium]|nr:polymerase subunit sigma-24 [Actinomycetes bacterium]
MAIRADDVDLTRDRMLVEAWQAGDAAAFDELYRTYFARLRSYCERRVGAAAAEEVAQDTFVKALRALPNLSGERRFYPWLTVIAGRLCIDHVRRLGRIQPRDDIDLGSVDDGHDARFALQADVANLDRALGRLAPRHAEVLELRERRELTYDEIAGQLGVPHSTVEALLFRARKALRREFQAVSAERLAAVPGLGWLAVRAGRLRARLAALGP